MTFYSLLRDLARVYSSNCTVSGVVLCTTRAMPNMMLCDPLPGVEHSGLGLVLKLIFTDVHRAYSTIGVLI